MSLMTSAWETNLSCQCFQRERERDPIKFSLKSQAAKWPQRKGDSLPRLKPEFSLLGPHGRKINASSTSCLWPPHAHSGVECSYECTQNKMENNFWLNWWCLNLWPHARQLLSLLHHLSHHKTYQRNSVNIAWFGLWRGNTLWVFASKPGPRRNLECSGFGGFACLLLCFIFIFGENILTVSQPNGMLSRNFCQCEK